MCRTVGKRSKLLLHSLMAPHKDGLVDTSNILVIY
jgi:hypothetical protein